MEKYIAFNVYGRNSYGAAVTRVLPDGEAKAVYLASDVHALLGKLEEADDASAVAGTVLRELMESST